MKPSLDQLDFCLIDFHKKFQQHKVVEIEVNIMASPLDQDILEQDFRILTSLGFGSSGKVKLACHLPTNTQVAIKVLEKNQNAVAAINSEVEILQSLEHRNIVQFFQGIDTLKRTYVVMEYVAGKDLAMFLREIGYLSEEKARPMFQQVVTAVHFVHQRLIAHCDIKLENILIERAGNVKLCDFGMAIQLTDGQMLKKVCGSLHYMAPEILARKRYDGLAVDMWSLGVVLYVLVTGKFPYEETTIHGMHRLITNTNYPIPDHLSKPCHMLIAQLLTVPTQHRITICQLLGRSWLGHIEEHVQPASKEVLPRVIEAMCTIGYTCDEIVSSLRLKQSNNKVTASFYILKHKLSYGDCPQQNGNTCLKSSPIVALHPLLHLKRRTSEPAFPAIIEVVKGHFQEVGVQGRGMRCQSYSMHNNYSCPELMPCSGEIVHEKSVPMASDITSATGDIAININTLDNLPEDLHSHQSTLDGRHSCFLNTDVSTKQPCMGSNMPNDQTQVRTPTSGFRQFRVWKMMRTLISHIFRALWFVPEPLLGES